MDLNVQRLSFSEQYKSCLYFPQNTILHRIPSEHSSMQYANKAPDMQKLFLRCTFYEERLHTICDMTKQLKPKIGLNPVSS